VQEMCGVYAVSWKEPLTTVMTPIYFYHYIIRLIHVQHTKTSDAKKPSTNLYRHNECDNGDSWNQSGNEWLCSDRLVDGAESNVLGSTWMHKYIAHKSCPE
jgi:hypothetical protein